VSDLYSRVGKAYFGNKDGGRKEEAAQATTSREEEAVAPTVVAPVAQQAPERASADCKASVEEFVLQCWPSWNEQPRIHKILQALSAAG